MHNLIKVVHVALQILFGSRERCCTGGAGRRRRFGGERERERRNGGATDGTPRCEGRRLPRVGVGGWKGGVGAVVGADKWVWEGGTFPQSASRDDEEGD